MLYYHTDVLDVIRRMLNDEGCMVRRQEDRVEVWYEVGDGMPDVSTVNEKLSRYGA